MERGASEGSMHSGSSSASEMPLSSACGSKVSAGRLSKAERTSANVSPITARHPTAPVPQRVREATAGSHELSRPTIVDHTSWYVFAPLLAHDSPIR